METLHSCPCCLSDVEMLCVSRSCSEQQQYYFFINCNHCGKGTPNAYPSKIALTALWNSIALENPYYPLK